MVCVTYIFHIYSEKGKCTNVLISEKPKHLLCKLLTVFASVAVGAAGAQQLH